MSSHSISEDKSESASTSKYIGSNGSSQIFSSEISNPKSRRRKSIIVETEEQLERLRHTADEITQAAFPDKIMSNNPGAFCAKVDILSNVINEKIRNRRDRSISIASEILHLNINPSDSITNSQLSHEYSIASSMNQYGKAYEQINSTDIVNRRRSSINHGKAPTLLKSIASEESHSSDESEVHDIYGSRDMFTFFDVPPMNSKSPRSGKSFRDEFLKEVNISIKSEKYQKLSNNVKSEAPSWRIKPILNRKLLYISNNEFISPEIFKSHHLYARDQSQNLTFDSEFESGNLLMAEQIFRGDASYEEYSLYLCPDPVVTEAAEKCCEWFFFHINNVTKAASYRINICNFSVAESGYLHGLRPLMQSIDEYGKDNDLGWYRTGSNFHYYPSIESESIKLSENCSLFPTENSYTLSFKLDLEKSNGGVYFASSQPYTYSRCLKLISSITSDKYQSKYAKNENLLTSVAGNSINVITVTDSHYKESNHSSNNPSHLSRDKSRISPRESRRLNSINNENESQAFINNLPEKLLLRKLKELEAQRLEENKKVIFLVARFHPNDTSGSFICEGFLQFLLSRNNYARSLRKAFEFIIVPMINPDGVINGHTCYNLVGQNIDKQWRKPLQSLHPGIYALKELISKIAKAGRLGGYFDFHENTREDCHGISFLSSINSIYMNHDTKSLTKILRRLLPVQQNVSASRSILITRTELNKKSDSDNYSSNEPDLKHQSNDNPITNIDPRILIFIAAKRTKLINLDTCSLHPLLPSFESSEHISHLKTGLKFGSDNEYSSMCGRAVIANEFECPMTMSIISSFKGYKNTGESDFRHIGSHDFIRFGRILGLAMMDAFEVKLTEATAEEILKEQQFVANREAKQLHDSIRRSSAQSSLVLSYITRLEHISSKSKSVVNNLDNFQEYLDINDEGVCSDGEQDDIDWDQVGKIVYRYTRHWQKSMTGGEVQLNTSYRFIECSCGHSDLSMLIPQKGITTNFENIFKERVQDELYENNCARLYMRKYGRAPKGVMRAGGGPKFVESRQLSANASQVWASNFNSNNASMISSPSFMSVSASPSQAQSSKRSDVTSLNTHGMKHNDGNILSMNNTFGEEIHLQDVQSVLIDSKNNILESNLHKKHFTSLAYIAEEPQNDPEDCENNIADNSKDNDLREIVGPLENNIAVSDIVKTNQHDHSIQDNGMSDGDLENGALVANTNIIELEDNVESVSAEEKLNQSGVPTLPVVNIRRRSLQVHKVSNKAVFETKTEEKPVPDTKRKVKNEILRECPVLVVIDNELPYAKLIENIKYLTSKRKLVADPPVVYSRNMPCRRIEWKGKSLHPVIAPNSLQDNTDIGKNDQLLLLHQAIWYIMQLRNQKSELQAANDSSEKLQVIEMMEVLLIRLMEDLSKTIGIPIESWHPTSKQRHESWNWLTADNTSQSVDDSIQFRQPIDDLKDLLIKLSVKYPSNSHNVLLPFEPTKPSNPPCSKSARVNQVHRRRLIRPKPTFKSQEELIIQNNKHCPKALMRMKENSHVHIWNNVKTVSVEERDLNYEVLCLNMAHNLLDYDFIDN